MGSMIYTWIIHVIDGRMCLLQLVIILAHSVTAIDLWSSGFMSSATANHESNLLHPQYWVQGKSSLRWDYGMTISNICQKLRSNVSGWDCWPTLLMFDFLGQITIILVFCTQRYHSCNLEGSACPRFRALIFWSKSF